jgi:5'-3' exoribonuclease 1
MGIPSYFSYIVKNHSYILKKISLNTMINHNLYMDCNSIIYDVVNTLDKSQYIKDIANNIIDNVIKKIDEHIFLLKPTNNIFIAFDGVAPVAKIQQQRERRYKSQYQSEINTRINNNNNNNNSNNTFNTISITPGTEFMKNLNNKIKLYYDNAHSLNKYNVLKIIVSTSDDVGEGEHKIFEYIRENPTQHNDNINTIVYGLDADLIMLSINHLPISKNIYLFRETPQFIKSINIDIEPNDNYLLNIPLLSKMIILEMVNIDEKNEITDLQLQQQYENKLRDYIFLCFFLGNDFLPHFPSINIRTGGIFKLLNAYKSIIKNTEYLTTNNKINWKNVKKIIKILEKQEESNLKIEINKRDKQSRFFYPTDTPENILKKIDSLPIIEREVEKCINLDNNNWQKQYYKVLFNIEINDERKKQICTNYLQGLEWNMKYYTTGCVDWKWKYNYHYPPLLSDLIHHIPYFNTDLITNNNNNNSINEITQLCMVMPPQHFNLIPNNVLQELKLKYPELYSNSTYNYEFIWAFCRYFWESHVQMPEININKLENIINNIHIK